MWESGPAGRHRIADALLSYALPRHVPGAAVAGTAGLLDGALCQQSASADLLASARRCAPVCCSSQVLVLHMEVCHHLAPLAF